MKLFTILAALFAAYNIAHAIGLPSEVCAVIGGLTCAAVGAHYLKAEQS